MPKKPAKTGSTNAKEYVMKLTMVLATAFTLLSAPTFAQSLTTPTGGAQTGGIVSGMW
jgi:hypothetical protein